jgi:hypothetical protein
MVTAETNVDYFAVYQFAVFEFWDGLKLSDGNNADLRREDERTGVGPANGSDVRKTDSSSLKLFRC